MLFCEWITDTKALSALKGGLDMNLPFWRDVRNKNSTTFDQLVEMITEEITNKNMILHKNRGGVALYHSRRMNYGRAKDRRPEGQEQQRRRNSKSLVRQAPLEERLEPRLIKEPKKAPIRQIDTIYGEPYIGGQTWNAEKSYAKETDEKLMTNWLINSRPSGSSKEDHISFIEEDMKRVHYLHCDALVVLVVVARNRLGRRLVDNDSSVNVIFLSTYEQINIDIPLEPSTEPLYLFTRDCVTPKGIVRLAVTMGEEPLATHIFMKFLVVDRRRAYHEV
ncbi:Uncharacterized protein Adt_06366 [Abeliophyllum distichum]|uniref:Uncharacterized protein n=1 Tax=Abeliophyllum distichum TaxID=126358 RepID=A0ABD1V8X5_9LAMI